MHSLGMVPKIGKVTEKAFLNLGISSLEDALTFIPRSYEDRRKEVRLSDTSEESPFINCRVTIKSHSFFPTKNRGRTLKVLVEDDNGDELELLCFNRDFLKNTLHLDSVWYIHAQVKRNTYIFQSSSFDIKRSPDEVGLGQIIPIYSLTEGVTNQSVRNVVSYALKNIPLPASTIPAWILEETGYMDYREALIAVHNPKTPEEIKRAKESLSFLELFLLELSVLRNRGSSKLKKTIKTETEKRLISSLPFRLTEDQAKAIDEINGSIDSKEIMNRLLEGDVGSGKTLVAWITALHVIASNLGQVAFMAPTELLARQHAENAASLLSEYGIRLAYITGDVKGKERKLLLENLKEGNIDLAIGTHALFSKDVEFRNLRYVIIDEQHRFGVNQREALKLKGNEVDILSMTATPIPRTLALTIFADMEMSVLHSMPEGRLPVITHIVSRERDKMYKAIGVEFQRGHQAYFVYPRIDDEGDSDLRDVTSMFKFLKKTYPGVPSALIHSKLPEEEKAQILSDFKDNKIKYLVSTSVIEVGIDVPNATCMTIEHADRFGLAALHQLRGRVGRSKLQSYCFLVADASTLTEDAKARLRVMRDTRDGFEIAEKDLQIRGPGEISGSKQSGFLSLKYASLSEDYPLIEKAKSFAEKILKNDRGLLKAENATIRRLLLQEIYS